MSRKKGPRLVSVPPWLVALAFTPTTVLALMAACRLLADVGLGRASALPFMLGLCAYPLIHAAFKPMGLYVFGHEMSHAIAAVLCGARVRKMKVAASGGHVVLDRSNAFIALAPYLIPLWAVVWLALTRLVSLWVPVPDAVFAAGFGLTLSFHFVLTAVVLYSEHQTDLDHGGGVFSSIVAIVFANSLVLVGTLKGLYPLQVSLKGYASGVAGQTHVFWRGAGRAALDAAAWALAQWKA